MTQVTLFEPTWDDLPMHPQDGTWMGCPRRDKARPCHCPDCGANWGLR